MDIDSITGWSRGGVPEVRRRAGKKFWAPTEAAKATSAFVYIVTFVGLRRVASLKRRPAGAEDLPSPTEETANKY